MQPRPVGTRYPAHAETVLQSAFSCLSGYCGPKLCGTHVIECRKELVYQTGDCLYFIDTSKNMQQIVFRLLGPPEISYKGQLIKIPRRRSRALLYYLVSTQSPQPRERLLTLLCGDVDEESARNTFKTLLAEVRSLLRGFDSAIEWIINEGDQLRLNPHAPLWLDTEIFEKMTAGSSRNLNQAIDLYRGSFLDGFFLKDAPDFDAWVRSARDHFHRLYIKALRKLAEVYESEKQFEQAIGCIQMLLTADPLLEEAYAHLMWLYWKTGHRIEALRQYERLCAVLARELAIRPSSSTQALYEQIARQSFAAEPAFPLSAQEEQQALPSAQPPPPPSSPSPPDHSPLTACAPLVGRAREIEWLRCHLTGTGDAYPLLLLQGSPGMGKSRLLQEVRSMVGSLWVIFQGTCQEIEQIHSYHAIVAALRQGLVREEVSQVNLPGVWLAQLARLLPDQFQLTASPQEYLAIEPLILADALVALLNGLARPQRPVLFLLDDLHWADSPTLALLGHLAAHVRRGSVFLLGTYCNGLAGGRLEPLRRSGSRQHLLAELTLAPLSSTDIRQLVAYLLTRTHLASLPAQEREALLTWCCQRSEGNPFFACAWLSLALKQPALPRQLSEVSLPESIETLVKQQLAQVSREALALLTAAASLGPSFDLQATARLLHLADSAAILASEELLQKDLIVEQAPRGRGKYTFTHRVVRDVILANTSAIYLHHFRQAAREL
jgi:DNA-binding SARP family transcriptional activator